MGCLKKICFGIIKKIIIIALIVAFFMFGGWAFVQNAIKSYQNPSRADFIKSEKNYGNFSSVSSDYQLCRDFNFFGYKKISAKHLPSGQKITIYDLKDEKMISTSDFSSNSVNKKIEGVLDKTKNSLITFEDFQIVAKGQYKAKNKVIPYIKFNSKVKNVPFKKVSGIIAIYSTTNEKAKNPSSKLIVTMTDAKEYNPAVIGGFIQAIKF